MTIVSTAEEVTEVGRWPTAAPGEVGTAADLERAARHYEARRDQQRGIEDYLARFDRRALRASRTYEGMTVVEVVLHVEDANGELTFRRPDGSVVG